MIAAPLAPAAPTTHRCPARDAAPSDEALFLAYRDRGCERSFRTLHDRHMPRIRGFFLKRLSDLALAEDLTQNVFTRILRAAPRFDPGRSTFSRWSHTIVENVLKNHYRSSSRNRLQAFGDLRRLAEVPVAETPAAAGGDHPDRAEDPEREAYRGEIRAALRHALERLDPLYREPFVLYQIEQRDFLEIAARLQIPVGTAKSRTHRARLQLRGWLREFKGE